MDKSHLARFEELSHYLIEHGFGDVFVKTKVITSLSFFEKFAMWFERKDPLAKRLRQFSIKAGPAMVNFIEYLSTRVDILDPKFCYDLSQISFQKSALFADSANNFVPEIKIGKKKMYPIAGESVFDGFSFFVPLCAKKSKSGKTKPTHFAYVIDPKLREEYLTDLEILHFVSTKLDHYYHFPFSMRKVVHEYILLVTDNLDLRKSIEKNKLYHSALGTKPQVAYLHKNCSKDLLVYPSLTGEIGLEDTRQAVKTYYANHNHLVKQAVELLCKPMFSHGFILGELELADLSIYRGGNLALTHVKQINSISKEQSVELALFLSALMIRDEEEVRNVFGVSVSLPESITTVAQIESILERIAKRTFVNHLYFDAIRVLRMCEFILHAFSANDDILTILKPHVQHHLAQTTQADFLVQKGKLAQAQKLLVESDELSAKLNELEYLPHPHRHIFSVGYGLIMLFCMLIIGYSLFARIEIIYVFLSVLVIAFLYLVGSQYRKF